MDTRGEHNSTITETDSTVQFERKNLAQIQSIEKLFSDHYSQAGYEEVLPVSINSGIDRTVNFVGSTISVLKPLFHEGVPASGVFMNQPCLRTQNMRIFYNDDIDIEYNSYFNTSAVLTPPNELNSTTHHAIDFISKLPENTLDRLVVRVSSDDIDLIEAIRLSKFEGQIEIDGREDSYYHWGYGDEGVFGRGLTLSVISPSDGQYRDIGNIVMMEKNGTPTAVEWGYGSETLLSRINDTTQPLESSVISDSFPYEQGSRAKFSDALAATIEMYCAGVTPADKGGRFILKEYLRGLSYLRRKTEVSADDLYQYGLLYMRSRGYDSETESYTMNAIYTWIESYDKRVERFASVAGRYILNASSDAVKDDDYLDTLRQRQGVHIKESQNIISSFINGGNG